MRSSAVARRRSAGMSHAARTRRAAIPRSPTTPVATGIAQSARVRRHADGWPTAKNEASGRFGVPVDLLEAFKALSVWCPDGSSTSDVADVLRDVSTGLDAN